ncbi:hypothetical protein FN846DRAFT_946779 [Sphaerosporella brunnea]|uniref:tRNA-splicing endonuclease subunit Sen15 domain-containing protein n=1 Tax=Sphaerosporella brunnea TaxID=1250544 RepID=A0A5J5EYQ1_9PEZI|nr:hypothetical protein FN846DRAFT_946779 [Sphaerosporella brunnea]
MTGTQHCGGIGPGYDGNQGCQDSRTEYEVIINTLKHTSYKPCTQISSTRCYGRPSSRTPPAPTRVRCSRGFLQHQSTSTQTRTRTFRSQQYPPSSEEVFDSLPAGDWSVDAKGGLRKKRLLLAVVDSTVVYYFVHDGVAELGEGPESGVWDS